MNINSYIQNIVNGGKILFEKKVQNTHSGNISILIENENLLITKSGSMKGYLSENDIIKIRINDKDFKSKGSSTETGTHQGIYLIKKSGGIVHTHSLDSNILSFVKKEIKPVDFFGKKYLRKLPVLKFDNPIGSYEMERRIPEYFKVYNSIIVKTHGIFSWGDDIYTALFNSLLSDFSSKILLNLSDLGINIDNIDLNYGFYDFICNQKHDRLIYKNIEDFNLISDILYKTDLSLFKTGSCGLIINNDIYYSYNISLPEYLEKPIFKVENINGNLFLEILNYLKKHSDYKSLIFNTSVYSLIHGFLNLISGDEFIFPNDAEGKLLYPKIPVILPDRDVSELLKLLIKHKLVLIIGVGTISIDGDLRKAIHHNSSLENITKINLSLIGLKKQLNLEKSYEYSRLL